MRNGGLIGPVNVSSAVSATGVWSASDQYFASVNNTWPRELAAGISLWLEPRATASYPGTGTTIFDLSGNGLNATGSAQLLGKFISDTQPYTTASTSILNTDTHSIFFMLQLNGTNGAWSKIFGYEAGGSDRSPGVWRWPSSRRLHWRYDPNNSSADFSTNSIVDDGGTEFSPGVWYYVGTTKSRGTATSYVNGVSIGSRSVSDPKTAGNAQIKLYPGYNQGTSMMGSVHIYNRALSANEVLANFNATRTLYGI